EKAGGPIVLHYFARTPKLRVRLNKNVAKEARRRADRIMSDFRQEADNQKGIRRMRLLWSHPANALRSRSGVKRCSKLDVRSQFDDARPLVGGFTVIARRNPS